MVRLLQYLNNISDWFWNILAFLQCFQGIFLQRFLNLSVLCGRCIANGIYSAIRKSVIRDQSDLANWSGLFSTGSSRRSPPTTLPCCHPCLIDPLITASQHRGALSRFSLVPARAAYLRCASAYLCLCFVTANRGDVSDVDFSEMGRSAEDSLSPNTALIVATDGASERTRTSSENSNDRLHTGCLKVNFILLR